MPKKIVDVEPVFIETFPRYELSAVQKALFFEAIVKGVDVLFLLWSRQVGKSNGLSYLWWYRLFNFSNAGEVYITMSPTEGDIKSLMIEDILIEAFGGKEIVYDINAVYVEPPEKWIKKLQTDYEKDIAEGKPESETTLSDWEDKGFIQYHNDKMFVKLFISDLSNTGEGKKNSQRQTGIIFTGAEIMCVAANHNLSTSIRGKKLKGCYGEEIGEYPTDPFSPVLPAIMSQEGWMIYAGTPSKKKPHNWLYEKYISVTESPFTNAVYKLGVDWYKASDIKELPLTPSEILSGQQPLTIKQTAMWSIGSIETIWPYVFDGARKFARIQASRQYPHKVEYDRDENGNFIKDDNGEFKFTIVPDFELDPNGNYPKLPPNPMGLVDDEMYEREFKMMFDAGSYKVFTGFNEEINVIDYEEFINSIYFEAANCGVGYDQGSLQADQAMEIEDTGKISATGFGKVACIPIPHTNDYQYVIYESDYIYDPTMQNIATSFHEWLLDGLPIVAESALWTAPGGVMDAARPIHQILGADVNLQRDKRAKFDIGIFKCVKRNWQSKRTDINNWFKNTSYKPKEMERQVQYIHPTRPGTLGRKLLITNNCKGLINFFSKATLQKSSDGSMKLKNMRKDLYDGPTYFIDIMEYNEAAKQKIKNYWNNHYRWHRHDQATNEIEITYNNRFLLSNFNQSGRSQKRPVRTW